MGNLCLTFHINSSSHQWSSSVFRNISFFYLSSETFQWTPVPLPSWRDSADGKRRKFPGATTESTQETVIRVTSCQSIRFRQSNRFSNQCLYQPYQLLMKTRQADKRKHVSLVNPSPPAWYKAALFTAQPGPEWGSFSWPNPRDSHSTIILLPFILRP